jgi:hypothetical protein
MVNACTALLLSLAFAGAPVLANYCTVSCEAAHTHEADAASPHAGHDRASTALFNIDQAPQPCGHDHHGIVGLAARSDDASVRVLAPASGVMPTSPVTAPGLVPALFLTGSDSPPGTALRGFASPLRV